ncbi:hypothetical protein [Nocardioides aequoreus]|uniref:hypothetical protein n=1 Tax=Nocardioides aequoreus TaxID=397278 RepID=UPI001B80B6F9|nr:hypothetical protein [Nocardioides aequoreus]
MEARPEFPESGLLVADEVLRVAGSSSVTIWDALESAAVPVAVEYFPVSEAEIAKYRTVPVNAAAQQSMVEIVKALNPNNPTLYRVVLPKGAELVKAVGTSGFRGFARSGGKIRAQAVLKPVAAGGAIAAGWPIFAVAGTVMAVDMVAQRELRAHQRRVETILGRQEERHYVERIKDQRSADAQLTRAISLMLDGHNPNLELALKSAYDEFHRSQQFLDKCRGVIEQLIDADGKVDYRRLEEVLGGTTKDLDYFLRELHMARGAIAIRRKALLADAASVALADPGNPYTALRKFLDSQVHELEQADAVAATITKQLTEIQLKGGWSIPKALKKQERLRRLAAAPPVDDDVEIRFHRTSSGEIVQVIAIEDDEGDQPTQITSGDESSSAGTPSPHEESTA